MMIVSIENGSLPEKIINEANFSDLDKTSATWIFSSEKTEQEIENMIHELTFNYTSNLKVNIFIDGNENSGFDNNNNNNKITRWSQNGHIYMSVVNTTSWLKAYKEAKKFKLAGQQGYLATITSLDEGKIANKVNNDGYSWVGGTRVVFKNGTRILDINDFNINDCIDSVSFYYWACGPEKNQNMDGMPWNNGEPNGAPSTYYPVYDNTFGDQRFESVSYTHLTLPTIA